LLDINLNEIIETEYDMINYDHYSEFLKAFFTFYANTYEKKYNKIKNQTNINNKIVFPINYQLVHRSINFANDMRDILEITKNTNFVIQLQIPIDLSESKLDMICSLGEDNQYEPIPYYDVEDDDGDAEYIDK
jgi:hypothetical protein